MPPSTTSSVPTTSVRPPNERDELPQPAVAQKKPSPKERAEHDREADRKHPGPDPDVRRHRAAEVARQQDGSEHGGLRDQVENGAGEQDDSKRKDYTLRI